MPTDDVSMDDPVEDCVGLRDCLKAVPAVTGVYLLAMLVTFEVLMPLQAAALPAYESYASLFYLPHAVRLMVAWWFGWRAIPILVPAVSLEVVYLYGAETTVTDVMVAMLTVIGPVLAFWALAKSGHDWRARRGGAARWPDLVIVGAVASVVGLLGPAFVYGNGPASLAAWFLGDITGMLLVFLPVQAYFRSRST